MLPIHFWHLMQVRHEPSSKKLRSISQKQCATLLKAATEDREQQADNRRKKKEDQERNPLTKLLPAVKKFLPTAPERMALGVARVIEKAEKRGCGIHNVSRQNDCGITKGIQPIIAGGKPEDRLGRGPLGDAQFPHLPGRQKRIRLHSPCRSRRILQRRIQGWRPAEDHIRLVCRCWRTCHFAAGKQSGA